MKLILKNFRCYVNKEYDIPDSGLVLLAGEIGKGKTTIIKAILYCLYGSKAVKKPCTFGTNSATVIMHYAGMKIKRTYRPKRVVVNDKYEDAVAQEMIDQQFGTFNDFALVSYVPQKNNKSILSLAQTEQLKVIEAIAFQGSNNAFRKEHLKKMIRESSTELTKVQAELDFVKSEMDESAANITPVKLDIPLEGLSIDDAIIFYQEELENFNDTLEEQLNLKNNLTTKIHLYNNLSAELARTNNELKTLEYNITDYQEQYDNLNAEMNHNPDKLQEQIDTLKLQLRYYALESAVTDLQEEYTTAKDTEEQQRKAKIRSLRENLWVKNGKPFDQNSCGELHKKYTQQYEVATKNLALSKKFAALNKKLGVDADTFADFTSICEEKVASFKNTLATLTKKREKLIVMIEKAKLAQDILHCPDCDASLRLVKGQLQSTDDDIMVTDSVDSIQSDLAKNNTKIKKCKKQLELFQKELRSSSEYKDINIDTLDINIDVLKEEIANLDKYSKKNIRKEQELKLLEEQQSSTALKNMKIKLKSSKKAFNEISYQIDKPHQTIDFLNTQLSEKTVQLANYTTNKKQLKLLAKNISTAQKRVKKLTTKQNEITEQLSEIDHSELQALLERTIETINTLRNDNTKNKKICKQIDKYQEYLNVKAVIDKWQGKYDAIAKRLEAAEKVHAANLTLKEKYAQAEILALEQTLDAINIHTNYYLEKMMDIGNLEAFLEIMDVGKKSTNYKIVTSIIFNGDHYDSINELSGGEFDLCTLASICGMNTMQNSPLLILDESLSSLDSDMNTDTFNLLSQVAEDKLVLVCSHEAVRGIFDDIVTVQKDYC